MRVDPAIRAPEQLSFWESRVTSADYVYFIQSGPDGPVKIGRSTLRERQHSFSEFGCRIGWLDAAGLAARAAADRGIVRVGRVVAVEPALPRRGRYTSAA
jgi:hypothetical protein